MLPLLFQALAHNGPGVARLTQGGSFSLCTQGKENDERRTHNEGCDPDELGEWRSSSCRECVGEHHGHAGRDVRVERCRRPQAQPHKGDGQHGDHRQRGVLGGVAEEHGHEAGDDADGRSQHRAKVEPKAHDATPPAAALSSR